MSERLSEELVKMATLHGHTMAVSDLMDAAAIVAERDQLRAELNRVRDIMQAERESPGKRKLKTRNMMLRKELQMLRAELAAAKALAEANWTECEKLRDSMWEYRADNARLREALNRAHEGAARQLAEPRHHGNDQYALTDIATTCELALAATPTQSLAEHDAAVKVAVLREVANELRNKESNNSNLHAEFVESEAIQIEAEADLIEKEAANGQA